MTDREESRLPRGARWRTSSAGAIRFNRDFSRIGVGRITRSSRTSNPKEFQHRDGILTKLSESGQIEVLRAFRDGRLTIEQLVDADREQRLKSSDLLGLLTIQQALWQSISDNLPKMGISAGTRKRYQVSFDALRRKSAASLSDRAIVADLERVNWGDLRKGWGRSSADWNHLRRAVSAYLSLLLGDKYHPFRRSVVKRIPLATEIARVPDVTPDVFWNILEHVPEVYKPCYLTIVATGMRVGEYLGCTRFNLKPATFSISAAGTKTTASAEDVAVHPKFWPSVEAAIPSPLGYKALRRHWVAACRAAGVSVRLHDLRHCFGQWGVDRGVPEAKVQQALRHKTASMTRRYTKTKQKGEAAYAVGEALLQDHSVVPPAQIAAQGGHHVGA